MNTYIRDNLNALRDGTGIANLAILTAHLANASVTPAKLSLGGATATILTERSRTGSGFGDPTGDTGPSVTLNVPTSGKVLLLIGCQLKTNTIAGGEEGQAGVVISGANTIAAGAGIMSGFMLSVLSVNYLRFGDSMLLTGLTDGSTTFKMVYNCTNATQYTYARNRIITVVPIG